MAEWNRRKWIVVASLVALILGGVVVHSYFAPEPREEPLPNPNGYDDFVAAGGMIVGDGATNTSAESLRQFVARNRPGLERARLGLSRPCRIPLDYTTNSTAYWTRRLQDLSSLKLAVRALAAEGKLAKMEGKPMDAAQDYAGCVKLGIDVAHGGVLIDALVAVACESIGVEGLKTTLPELNGTQAGEVLGELESLEATRESKKDLLNHEEIFMRKSPGFQYVFYDAMRLFSSAYKAGIQKALAKYDAQRRRTQGLEVELAEHAFELEQGRKAHGWGDLVPAYLKEIPKDPTTEEAVSWPRVSP